MASSDLLWEIYSAPESEVREILAALCVESFQNQSKAQEFFIEFRLAQSNQTTGTKRKAEDDALAICIKCQQVFCLYESKTKSCRYHVGEYCFLSRLFSLPF